MSGIRLVNNGHQIEVQLNTMFSAVEIVRYDGKEMARKFSLFGTTHTFETPEDGKTVKYEVETFFKWYGAGCKVRRDGQLIFEHTS